MEKLANAGPGSCAYSSRRYVPPSLTYVIACVIACVIAGATASNSAKTTEAVTEGAEKNTKNTANPVSTDDRDDNELDRIAVKPTQPAPAVKPQKRARPNASSGVSGVAGDGGVVFTQLSVITACQNRDFAQLTKQAEAARQYVAQLRVPEKGWRAKLPVWINKAKVNFVKNMCHLPVYVNSICYQRVSSNMSSTYIISVGHSHMALTHVRVRVRV